MLSWGKICICPTKDQSISSSSDYLSYDGVVFCSPIDCKSGFESPKFKTTTTTQMTTTCVAIPSFSYPFTENSGPAQTEVRDNF